MTLDNTPNDDEDDQEEEDSSLFEYEVSQKLLNVDRQNILNRLKAGKTLTETQRARLFDVENRFAKNQVQLASMLGVDRKTIARWRKEDDFPEPKSDGRWDVVACQQWRRDRSQQAGSAEDQSQAEGQARKVWLQVEKLEHDLEVAKGSYIQTDEAAAEVRRLVSIARGILLGIGDKLAPIVISMSSVEAAKRINEEIDYALSQIQTADMDVCQ